MIVPIRRVRLAFLGLVALSLALMVGCSGGGDESAPPDQPASSGSGGGHAHADGGVIALVMAAVDMVDSAGLHGMQEELEKTGQINDRWAGTVENALVSMRLVPWEADIAHGAGGMIAALEAFHTALTAGDVSAATQAAEGVHEAQHHFSPDVYAWLAQQSAGHDEASVLVTSMAAIDVVDSAGFHDMGSAINDAGEVSSRHQGKVSNALAAVAAASWPEEVEATVEALQAALEQTATKMEAQDVEGSLAGLQAIHDAQHELSHGYYGWLAAHHDSIDHSDRNVALACTLKSVDLVGSVGLHGMSEDLSSATAINERYLGQIERVSAAFAGAPHHGDAAGASTQMRDQLVALRTALEADDLEEAREAAHAAHEAQHDLSHTAFAWLAESAAGGGTALPGDTAVEREVTVEMIDVAFEPKTINLKAGEVVALQFVNTGVLEHDFVIDEMPGHAEMVAAHGDGDGDHHHGEEAGASDAAHMHLEPGQNGTMRIRVDQPGEYDFYCSVSGHREEGMVGVLRVE